MGSTFSVTLVNKAETSNLWRLYNYCVLIDYLINKIQKEYKALDKVLEKLSEKQLKANQEIPII